MAWLINWFTFPKKGHLAFEELKLCKLLLLPHWNPWGRRADFYRLAAESACSWNSDRLQGLWPMAALPGRNRIRSRVSSVSTEHHPPPPGFSRVASMRPIHQTHHVIWKGRSFRANSLPLGFAGILCFNLALPPTAIFYYENIHQHILFSYISKLQTSFHFPPNI